MKKSNLNYCGCTIQKFVDKKREIHVAILFKIEYSKIGTILKNILNNNVIIGLLPKLMMAENAESAQCSVLPYRNL